MELTTAYIISQIFTIITYALLALTYYTKNRKSVLIISLLANAANGVAYIFLGAYTGLAMSIVAVARSLIFMRDKTQNKAQEKINRKDITILIALYAISIISAIFTYKGFFSLFSVFANMIYTYSICQKKINTYKFLGIPTEICGIIYEIYIMSIFGVILETIVLIFSITGYVGEIKKRKQQGKMQIKLLEEKSRCEIV